MTKAADPDRSAVLWYRAGRRSARAEAEAEAEAAAVVPETRPEAAGGITVEVMLFGLLSTLTTDRSVTLTLPAGATTLDVLAALEERFGAGALEQVRDPGGGVLPCCRVFVDGVAREEAGLPLSASGEPTKVELILLKGFVGG